MGLQNPPSIKDLVKAAATDTVTIDGSRVNPFEQPETELPATDDPLQTA